MYISGAFSSCTKNSDSDNDCPSLKRECEKDKDSGIVAPHKNEKIFYVDRFHSKKETQTKMKYETRCPVLSSSWKVIVDMTISEAYHSIHLLITVIRTDSGKIPLEGIVYIWCLNAAGKTCPVSYRVSHDLPFKVKPSRYNPLDDISNSVHESCFVNKHFACLFKDDFDGEDNIFLPEDLLILKIQLFVRGCCDGTKVHQSILLDDISRKHFDGEEGTSRMHSEEGEGTSKRHSDGEGTSKRHCDGEGTSKIHFDGEDTSKIHFDGEDTSKIHFDGEDTSKIHFDGEDTSKIHFDGEDTSKVHSDGEGTSKSHSQDEDTSEIYSCSRSKL